MDEHTTDAHGREEDRQVFRQVRSDIQAGELSWAEELLDGVEDRCAEWHFLKGAICYRKGWMDEARRYYQSAYRMEPGNEEYKRAAVWMRDGTHYHPKGKPFGTLCTEDVLPRLCCAASVCGMAAAACGAGYLCYVCYGCFYCCTNFPD